MSCVSIVLFPFDINSNFNHAHNNISMQLCLSSTKLKILYCGCFMSCPRISRFIFSNVGIWKKYMYKTNRWYMHHASSPAQGGIPPKFQGGVVQKYKLTPYVKSRKVLGSTCKLPVCQITTLNHWFYLFFIGESW